MVIMRLHTENGGLPQGNVSSGLAHVHKTDNVSGQISSPTSDTFITSFEFVPDTLDVHFNGALLTEGGDYTINPNNTEFTIIHPDLVGFMVPGEDCVIASYHLAGIRGSILDDGYIVIEGREMRRAEYEITALEEIDGFLNSAKPTIVGSTPVDVGTIPASAAGDEIFRDYLLITLNGIILVSQPTRVNSAAGVTDGDVARGLSNPSRLYFRTGITLEEASIVQIIDFRLVPS